MTKLVHTVILFAAALATVGATADANGAAAPPMADRLWTGDGTFFGSGSETSNRYLEHAVTKHSAMRMWGSQCTVRCSTSRPATVKHRAGL
jgi:hypothetical protein